MGAASSARLVSAQLATAPPDVRLALVRQLMPVLYVLGAACARGGGCSSGVRASESRGARCCAARSPCSRREVALQVCSRQRPFAKSSLFTSPRAQRPCVHRAPRAHLAATRARVPGDARSVGSRAGRELECARSACGVRARLLPFGHFDLAAAAGRAAAAAAPRVAREARKECVAPLVVRCCCAHGRLRKELWAGRR